MSKWPTSTEQPQHKREMLHLQIIVGASGALADQVSDENRLSTQLSPQPLTPVE